MRSKNTKSATESSGTSLLHSHNHRVRSLGAIGLLAAIFFLYWLNPLFISIAMWGITMGLTIEWATLLRKRLSNPKQRLVWFLGGLIYFIMGTAGFYIVFQTNHRLVYLAFMTVVLTDSLAYLVGRRVGGPKLCPTVSPNKTWSGFLGGFLTSQLHTFIFFQLYPSASLWKTILLTSFLSIFGHIGDLFESSLKRALNVKDTGNILPGHGGFFDRFDGLLAVGLILLVMHFFKSCP